MLLIDPDIGIVDQLFPEECSGSQKSQQKNMEEKNIEEKNMEEKNMTPKKYIECGVNKVDKADRLLEVMKRRSVADFIKLVYALNSVGQPLLARALEEGKGN